LGAALFTKMAQQFLFVYFNPKGKRAIAAFKEYKDELDNPHDPKQHKTWNKSKFTITSVHIFNCGSSTEGTIHILDQQFHHLQAHIIVLTGTRQLFDSTEDKEHFTYLSHPRQEVSPVASSSHLLQLDHCLQ
jgi:hypothetical protein